MGTSSPFSIRSFLRIREALLVHFNTPMSVNHPTGFPDDLRHAKGLVGHPISFSTIQVGDRGPWQGGPPADANAAGSVGMIVDVQEAGSVRTVDAQDSGSSGQFGSGGKPPDAQTCADSITGRTTSNEWWIQDYTSLGIFIFLPAQVFVKRPGCQGERPTDLAEVLVEFADDRIFSVLNGSFIEYDRSEGKWVCVAYGDIVPT
jgi:hypothetical protein